MAYKSDALKKFEAIQANNEEIAQQEYVGMKRTSSGWMSNGLTSGALLGATPILKSGGLGSKILDTAANEPVPKTTGQEIMKQAGKWRLLDKYYNQKFQAPDPNAPSIEQLSKKATTPGHTSAEGIGTGSLGGTGTSGGTSTAATYNVNGQQMSLGEYISAMGAQNPNDTFKASVRQANAAYDRQRATYGAQAEALAGQGLTNSGTSDYLDAQAYAEKQKAISSAAASRNQQMASYAGSYSSYLQQEQAERQAQIETALERAMTMQLSTDNTVKYLMAMTGMTKSEARRYAEAGSVLTSTTTEDTARATLQEIADKFVTLTSTDTANGGMGMSTEAARQYLKSTTQGYDGALVDQAVNDLLGLQEQTAADQKAAAQKQVSDAVSEAFDKVFDPEYTNEEATAALAQVGITLTPDEEKGIFNNYETKDAIDSAYRNGMIDEETYQSLTYKNIDTTIDEEIESGKLGNLLQVAVNYGSDAETKEYVIDKLSSKTKVISRQVVTDTSIKAIDSYITTLGANDRWGKAPTAVRMNVSIAGKEKEVNIPVSYSSTSITINNAKNGHIYKTAGNYYLWYSGKAYKVLSSNDSTMKKRSKLAGVTPEQLYTLVECVAELATSSNGRVGGKF